MNYLKENPWILVMIAVIILLNTLKPSHVPSPVMPPTIRYVTLMDGVPRTIEECSEWMVKQGYENFKVIEAEHFYCVYSRNNSWQSDIQLIHRDKITKGLVNERPNLRQN